ncbi:right-handed parallel beta-helix repeat-containing protein [Halobellus sp. GM3]|uniref:right-handed parallel beta-helix repeat-containing protein n=1 Tax=Halobellus sp. GM3 TaxID=3458410 RepID=UPI00403DF57E
MASITGSTVAQTAQSVNADTVVDLGEQGLSEGDVIDDYLEQYFESGVEVRIPEGEYEYHGSGLGGSHRNAAVVGMGEVIFTNEVGEYRETIEADGGVVEVRNITLRGAAELSRGEEARFRLQAGSDGHVLIDNFNLPDGVADPGNAIGFYTPSDHAGVVEIKNCYIANFSNNGIYASSPGKGSDGQVIVDSCFVRNNNITGIRLGSSESVARNCLVLNDKQAPHIYSGSAINMRGIRIREAGDDLAIENCEIIHSYEGAGGPIVLHHGAEGGTGSITDTLIRNNTGTDAVLEKGSAADGWTANNLSISGEGNLEYPSHFEGVCVGDDCPVPTGDDPQNDGTSGGTDDSNTGDSTTGDNSTDTGDNSTDTGDNSDSSTDESDTDVGTGGTELVIVTENSDGVQYEFTATGEITGLYDRSQYSADTGAPADEVTENDDGTWTATGATGGGGASGDAFQYEGSMASFSASGDVDAMTLYADGTEVSADDLLAAGGTGDDESSDADGSDGSDGSGSDDSRQKTVIFDGTAAETVAAYTFRVTGEVTRDASISTAPQGNRFDSLDDVVDGDEVDGVLGKGIDGYRYTGRIVEIEVDGSAAVTMDHE